MTASSPREQLTRADAKLVYKTLVNTGRISHIQLRCAVGISEGNFVNAIRVLLRERQITRTVVGKQRNVFYDLPATSYITIPYPEES